MQNPVEITQNHDAPHPSFSIRYRDHLAPRGSWHVGIVSQLRSGIWFNTEDIDREFPTFDLALLDLLGAYAKAEAEVRF